MMLKQQNTILVCKIVTLAYIALINLFPLKLLLVILNSPVSKLVSLALIAFVSFFDYSLALLITVALVMTILIHDTKDIQSANITVDSKKNIDMHILPTVKEGFTVGLPEKKYTCEKDTFDDIETLYPNNIHSDVHENLPSTPELSQIQNNIFEEKNANLYVSVIPTEHINIQGLPTGMR